MCMTTYQPLPASGVGTLLRALFKGARAAHPSAPLATTYELRQMDAASIGRYNDLLGFAMSDLPITYYYLLAQRAHLATMLGSRFPFRLAGMVHVENAIVERMRADLALPMTINTRVEVEPAKSNGARYCQLLTTGTQRDATVFECRSRYLAVRGQRQAVRNEPAEIAAAPTSPQPAGEWVLTQSSGREYASVSGDWNPIHLWPWSARLLGMKAPIIHGMHTVAKACAMLEQQEGRRLREISAHFKSPIELGARVELRPTGPNHGYQIWAGGKLAVEGRWN